MSTQSLIHNTDSKIATQINNFLAKAGKDHLMFKRFEVGSELSYVDIRKFCRLFKIFCENKCDLLDENKTLIKENINKILIYSNGQL